MGQNLHRLGPARAGTAFNSELFTIARTMVRMAEEDTKSQLPNGLREFGSAGRESLEQAAVLRSADLRRFGNREARRFAQHVHGTGGRR